MSVEVGHRYSKGVGSEVEVIFVGTERAMMRRANDGSEFSAPLNHVEAHYTQIHPEPLPKGLTRISDSYYEWTDEDQDKAEMLFPGTIVQIKAKTLTNFTPEVLEFLLKKVRG